MIGPNLSDWALEHRSLVWYFMIVFALTGVFVVVGLTLNLLLWRFFIRPILQLSALADRVSNGDLDAPEFRTGARDEIDALAQSFSRMRASVTQAMRLLDA